MKITPINYNYSRNSHKANTTFKSSGTGALIGWGGGLSAGITLAVAAAITRKTSLSALLNSITILASGISGAFFGEKIEQAVKTRKSSLNMSV